MTSIAHFRRLPPQNQPHVPRHTCAHCGQLYYRQPSKKGQWCSHRCAAAARQAPLPARLWAKIDQSGGPEACWPWQGYCNPDGYGQIGVKDEGWHMRLTHRVAWELTHGPIPAGYMLCHHCDNPPCCNPAHLFLGLASDNAADKRRKGRALPGEQNPTAKLTQAQAEEIRARYAAGGISQAALAREYGITAMGINHIIRGVAYRPGTL